MRLVVFGPERKLGVLHDDQVIDVNAGYAKYLSEVRNEPFAYEMASAIAPAELGDFILSGDRALEAVEQDGIAKTAYACALYAQLSFKAAEP